MARRDASDRIRLTGTAPREPHEFELRPDADTRAALADELEVSALKKLVFEGRLEPSGRRDWVLRAELGATVVQPCGVTLAPVTTRIDERIERRYLAGLDMSDAPEQEMPDDVEAEPLPAMLDLAVVMSEALALAIPPFPRAEGVDPLDAETRPAGADPISDDDTRPFAGLADALKRSDDKTD